MITLRNVLCGNDMLRCRLGSNKIGDGGAVAFARALQINRSVTGL
jgi:hypothetical protein